MKPVNIIDRGRGPEIEGTRITAYDIYPYLLNNYHHTFIAATLGISSREVLAMTRYIENHKDEVEAEHQCIEKRLAQGNPPEVETKRKQSQAHKVVNERLQKIRSKQNGTIPVSENSPESNDNERNPDRP